MLRDTSAASTSSRSVVCAPNPPPKASSAARKTAAETADRITKSSSSENEDRPTGTAAEGCRRTRTGTPHLRSEITDAYRPDPPLDRHRAARDQGDHCRGRAVDRTPAPLDWPADPLHPAHFGL